MAPALAPAVYPSRQEAVAAALRLDILRGRIPAGARLDIDEIANRHGVSRTPVRDALKQLEGEGLIQVLPYRGVEVTRLTAENLRELFAIRIALERLALAQATVQVTEAELMQLRGILRRMDRYAVRDEAWMRLNAAFHDGVHAASRWPRLIEMIRVQRTNVERYVRAGAADLGVAQQQAEHWQLIEAMTARQPELAATLIAQHLSRTAETLARMSADPVPAPE
ncbi:GntR family transcriptional regulator [Falsiroseomonas sp. E2-1-a4]|uniref:GntR family transcriptional regulator n=1 Tax=Falsiroseomonas sp. E2-1-a4 TaxID=3239299 RepID=UPI003F2D04DC